MLRVTSSQMSVQTQVCVTAGAIQLPLKGWQLYGSGNWSLWGDRGKAWHTAGAPALGQPPAAAPAKEIGHLGQVCAHTSLCVCVCMFVCVSVLVCAVSSHQICSPPSILQSFFFSFLPPSLDTLSIYFPGQTLKVCSASLCPPPTKPTSHLYTHTGTHTRTHTHCCTCIKNSWKKTHKHDKRGPLTGESTQWTRKGLMLLCKYLFIFFFFYIALISEPCNTVNYLFKKLN